METVSWQSVHYEEPFASRRKRRLTVTAGLENFAKIVDEEWSYLGPYLDEWRENKKVLFGHALDVEWFDQRFFLYSLCLKKPEAADTRCS